MTTLLQTDVDSGFAVLLHKGRTEEKQAFSVQYYGNLVRVRDRT